MPCGPAVWGDAQGVYRGYDWFTGAPCCVMLAHRPRSLEEVIEQWMHERALARKDG